MSQLKLFDVPDGIDEFERGRDKFIEWLDYNDVGEDDVVVGVDEAGRGALIGPMVVAAVGVKRKNMGLLSEMGVDDSKNLSGKSRMEIRNEIYNESKIFVGGPRTVSSDEIDKARNISALGGREVVKSSNQISWGSIYLIDGDIYDRFLGRIDGRTYSMPGADEVFPPVSAASVVAKAERDKQFNKIKEQLSERGVDVTRLGNGGYPSDSKGFVEDQVKKEGEKDDYVWSYIRESWKTVYDIREKYMEDRDE